MNKYIEKYFNKETKDCLLYLYQWMSKKEFAMLFELAFSKLKAQKDLNDTSIDIPYFRLGEMTDSSEYILNNIYSTIFQNTKIINIGCDIIVRLISCLITISRNVSYRLGDLDNADEPTAIYVAYIIISYVIEIGTDHLRYKDIITKAMEASTNDDKYNVPLRLLSYVNRFKESISKDKKEYDE